MLKHATYRILLSYLFWLVFFSIGHFVFLISNLHEAEGASLKEYIMLFVHATYLDTSMSAYLLGVPLLISSIHLFWNNPYLLKIYKGFHVFFIVVNSIVITAEIPIYKEWHTKLNFNAIRYLANPAEVFKTATAKELIFGLLSIVILTAIGIYLFNKFVGKTLKIEEQAVRSRWWQSSLYFISFLFLIAIGIRGGLQQIPIQQSDVYFSNHNVLNLAATNSSWNLMQSVWESKQVSQGNPYKYYTLADAQKTIENLYFAPKDTTVKVLNTTRPNIVMIVMEGWSADLVKACGGYDSLTPNFENLTKDGILFTNCYASGGLSEEGHASIFSGYPAQPVTRLCRQPEKFAKVPHLFNYLHDQKYENSYLFGGDLSYGNIKAYMYQNHVDALYEQESFDESIPRGKLGIHDEYLMDKATQLLHDKKAPFFFGMFTASTHSPYDYNMKEVFHWGNDEKEYINGAYYTDKQIGKFIAACKKEPWYANTLFVFVSDHSHNTPHHYYARFPEYRKIPMMLYGEVIKNDFRGLKMNQVCSQIDLVSSLLHQMNYPAKEYKWSKNLFNPYTPSFAYFSTDAGLGLINKNGAVVYTHSENKIELLTGKDSLKTEKQGKSFLQVMFEEYSGL